MSERYLILKINVGYFSGIDYATNKAIFGFECIQDENAVLFRTEAEASKRLFDLMVDCKNMRGLYKIARLILIS